MKRIKRDIDFSQFVTAVTRSGRPSYLPFYEHVASPQFIARRTETHFDAMTIDDDGYWEIYVDFWFGMGYDCIPMEVPLDISLASDNGGLSHGSEAHAVITCREDFERFDWPDVNSPLNFRHFDTVSALLPEGVKIVGGVQMGPYEWVSQMMGVMGLSYSLLDDPELVSDMFSMIGRLHHSAFRQIATFDAVGALRQGDDLGFKSATFLSPELLRQHVFPAYRNFADEAHANGKPFILHSCGNLAEVYEDIIGCGVDAKHSFEDVIMPVEDFKAEYGDRITALGGLDVDVICRAEEDELRRYARKKIEKCFVDGHWTLGTGNSLTDYMPVENYIIVLEEGLKISNT